MKELTNYNRFSIENIFSGITKQCHIEGENIYGGPVPKSTFS